MPVHAQSDQYWQQICGAKDAQSNLMMVNLLKQLDDKQKEIDNLKSQLAAQSQLESKSNGGNLHHQ